MLTAGCLTTLLAAGCASGDAEGRPRVVVSARTYFVNAPILLAQAEGYFEEEGIDVRIVESPGGSTTQMLPALTAGRVDVVAGSPTIGFLSAMAQGARVRFVVDRGRWRSEPCSYGAIVARRDLVRSGAVRSVADLGGRRVALHSNVLDRYTYETALRKAGLAPDSVEDVQVPPPSVLDALDRGAVDAASIIEPWLTHTLAAGHEIVLSAGEVTPNAQLGVLTFGPRLLDREPDLGRRFIRGYLRGVARYAEGKTARNLDVLERVTGMERDFLARICWPPFQADGRIDSDGIVAFQRWAVEQGLLDEVVPESGFWDPRFVDAARDVVEAAP
ncbi:MAG TPA: ABC transporter substrate-binding protein [Gemmatimonadota bacterium]|jgi:NitT/TauT family transport system substrate-binding protein